MVSKTGKRQVQSKWIVLRNLQKHPKSQLKVETSVKMLDKLDQIWLKLISLRWSKMLLKRSWIKYGINVNAKNVRSDAVQSSSKTNNCLVDNDDQNDLFSSRATHFFPNNDNKSPNRSREYNWPNPAALAKQNKTGLKHDNCLMATEIGLPRNGNKDDRNTATENLRTHDVTKIPEFLTGNPLQDTTNDVLNFDTDHTRTPKQR